MSEPADTIVLLRHARAGQKLREVTADAARGLDPVGRAIAEALPDVVLEHLTPTAIVSSPLRRCVETVAPLAASTDLPIDRDDALRVGADMRSTAGELLRRLPGGAVACTHGEVIEALFGPFACEKGAFVLVRRVGPSLEPTLYVPPPALRSVGERPSPLTRG